MYTYNIKQHIIHSKTVKYIKLMIISIQHLVSYKVNISMLKVLL